LSSNLNSIWVILYTLIGINYNIPELKNYILTPEDFLSSGKTSGQYARLLHFRSTNGKQGNLSSKKKNLNPQIKGVFQF
jgi:hypothetical protein